MKQFIAFVRKEFFHIFRDRRTMLILLGMPVVQIILFGFAITTEVKNVRVAILDPSNDVVTRCIIDRLDASEYFSVTTNLNTPDEVEKSFRRGDIDLAVIFSEQFANHVYTGDACVQLVADATDPNTATTQTGYAANIISSAGSEMLPAGIQVSTIVPEVKLLYNPQMKSAYNFVPGVMGLILMLICAMMTSISIVREKETGTMEILLVSPVKPLFIILAKAVPYFVLSFVNLTTILLLSVYVLDVPVAGSLFWLIVVSLLFIFVSLALGLLISSVTRTQVAAMLASGLILMMPTMLLSGMIFPIESMPLLLQGISAVLPARWYIQAVRKLMIEGVDISLVLSVRLTIIVVVFLILMFIFIKNNGKRSKKYYHRQQKELGNINGFVQEMMAGQKVEKVFNHEQENFEKFCEMNESFRKESTNALAYSGMLIPVIVSLSYFNYALSACVGGIFVIKGIMDLGSISAYLVYVRQSAMPLNQFTQQVNFILSALSGAERIFDMMDEAEEPDEGKVTLCNVIKNADNTLTETSDKTGFFAWKLPAGELIELKGDVRFNDVVFGYVPEKRVLNKISLFAKPGQKIAFVGSTGAGKTTIVNLINRFYDIQSGTITYDGIDVKDIKKDDLRRSLAMVIQDTHLFTGTIADNIRYGKLDATDEEIREAAKIANADSFITRLPRGYDTMLTADGSNLSQGQRQLLAIARAAIAKPPVLILDEATSSIDTRTERLIEKGMDAIMEGRTVFVIAHRLSTVRNSNAIMVLEKGEVIERGSHDELLEQKGRYYQLYTGQFELD